MKRMTYTLVGAIGLLMSAHTVLASDLKVIANSSVGAASISAEELKGVFLLVKTSLAEGSRVEPVLAKGGEAHEAFVRQYLGKSDGALQTYYRSLVFTGKGSMPKVLASDAEVVSWVAGNKGAIGYVSAGTSASGVKTLDVK